MVLLNFLCNAIVREKHEERREREKSRRGTRCRTNTTKRSSSKFIFDVRDVENSQECRKLVKES